MKLDFNKLVSAFGIKGFADGSFAKKIASRYSRGNVRLQLGRVVTSEEYERRKSHVLAYDFD